LPDLFTESFTEAKLRVKSIVFVICQHRTSSGLSDPQFINTASNIHRQLAYAAAIKSVITKGFL
jgi:hypothetical protein